MNPAADAIITRAPTADGASIACKRRPADGPPVLIVHGLGVNADVWDARTAPGSPREHGSLAARLQAAGYDVWLMNLRGSGRPHMHSRPPPGQRDWCVDHFIHYDLPAVLAEVRRTRGQRPFVIGNSLGAMSLAAYWQGAHPVEADGKPSIGCDERVAAQRQAEAAGGIFVEFPAALRWPVEIYDAGGRLQWRNLIREILEPTPASNGTFEVLARLAWLETILAAMGVVRFDWIRPRAAVRGISGGTSEGTTGGTADHPAPEDAESPAERAWQAGLAALRHHALRLYAAKFKGAAEFDARSFVDGVLPAADHLKAGVLQQLARSVRARGFVSALGTGTHVYSDHYRSIALPTLVLAGGRDRIANAGITRAVFFETISAHDKTFLLFDDIAHGEFAYSPRASAEVYPQVLEWLAQRRR